MESGLLLDVVVSEGSAVFKLLTGEDESLLIRGDALLVLDLGLDVLDGVGLLDLKGDGLASKSFDEDLHCCWVVGCLVGCWFNYIWISQQNSLVI